MSLSSSQLKRLIIREMYNTSLSQLYEQAPPAPAPAPAADPAAGMFEETPAVPPVPGAAVPAVDPAAAAAAVPAVDPAAAVPAVDPAAAAVPAVPGAAAAVPAAAAAGEAAKKSAKAPDPAKEPGKAEVNKAFSKAMSAATESEGEVASESLRRKSLRFLIEQEDKKTKIDMSVYAGEIAKLINNYTSLIDVKKSVITQAEEYLSNDFPKEADALKKQLKDLLRKDYHISLERPEAPSDSYAVGAGAGGGGGAA